MSFDNLQELFNLVCFGLPPYILEIHQLRHLWMYIDMMIAINSR